MQEVFEKIKQRLEEKSNGENIDMRAYYGDAYCKICEAYDDAIEIVDQVAEEYSKVSVEGDLISRSALQEELRKVEEKCEGALILPSWLYACRIIKNQPSIQNDGWIPCSERLPEESGSYICYVCGIRSAIAIYSFAKNLSRVDEYDFEGKNKSGFYNYDSEYGYYEMSNVIAWQPLPAPYKKEV